MVLLISPWPRGTVICSFLGNHSSCSYWGKGAFQPPFWEQSNAVWILIKFIKQITQRLGEAGVHLLVLQTDLCRDASWMVVKAKLPSSADGLLSPVGEIWWRSSNSFPPPGFCSLQLWLKKPFSVFSQPCAPLSHPTPLCLCEQCLNLSDLLERQVPADLILCMCCKAQAEDN